VSRPIKEGAGGGTDATPKNTVTNGFPEFSALLGLQRHEPLDAETRAEIDLLIKAADMGFRLATKCLDCGHWLSSPASLRRHLGPRCAARRAVAE
jgi:hypothetical protein